MGRETRNDRRRFLTTTLCVGLFVLARPCHPWSTLATPWMENTLGSGLGQILKHTASARIIGQEYLREAPQEADVQTLARLLWVDFPQNSTGLREVNTVELRARLRLRTRQDFEEGRIVRLQSWMVAVTEARLCALVSLA
jgi:hypothetical protein